MKDLGALRRWFTVAQASRYVQVLDETIRGAYVLGFGIKLPFVRESQVFQSLYQELADTHL